MYATARLLGFESLAPSLRGAQSPQIPVKPTPDVQKLLDAAAKLPQAEQVTGYEKALDAAIAAKDPAGTRFSAREIRNLLIALKRTNEVEPYLLGLQKRAQQAIFPLMEAHVLVNLALTYEAAKQIDKTIAAYEAAGKLFEACGDKAGQSRAIGNMAKTLGDIGKSAEAKLAFDRALPLAKKSGDLAQVASILGLSAALYEGLGNLMKALSLYEESLPIWRDLRDKTQVARTALIIAKYCADRGDLTKALSLYEESQTIWREQGDDLRVSVVQNFIDKIRQSQNQIDKEVPRLEEALSIQRKRGDIEGIAKSIDNLARFHQDNGPKSKSLLLYEESLALWRKVGNKRAIAARLSDIASIHDGNGNLPKALSNYEESLVINREIGNKFDIAVNLRNLADCLKTIGDLRKSLRTYKESLPIFRELGDMYFIAETLNDIAEMSDLLGQPGVAIKLRAEATKIRPNTAAPDNLLNQLQRPKILSNALKFYEDLLAKQREIGNKAGIAESLNDIANVHRALGDLANALKYYEESLANQRELTDKIGIAHSLSDIAGIHQTRGDTAKAQAMYVESLAIHREQGDKSGIASLLGELANIHNLRNDHPPALSMYEESLAIYRELMDKLGIAQCLNNIASIHRFRGDISKALGMHEESLSINRDLENKSGIANNLGGIAGIYETRGDFSKALGMYEESLEIRKELRDKSGIARSLRDIAGIYKNRGDFSKALGMYEESLEIRKELGDKSGIANNLGGIAGIYETRGDITRALEMYEESLAIESALGNRYHVAIILSNIARVYQIRGDLTKAMSLYEQSLVDFRELGEKSSIAKCLNNLAAIHTYRGDSYKAIEMYKESLAINKDLGDKSGIATNLANIASNYYLIADSEKALSLYEQSLSLFREAGDKLGIAAALSNIADISSVTGDRSKALAMYEESLAVSRQAGDKLGMASTQNNMAIVHNNLGDLAKALKSYEESLALHRDVGDKQGIATSLANIASLFDDIGMQSKAFPARQEALRLFEQVGDTKGQAQVMGQIGDSLLSLGDAAGALSWFEKAFGLLGPDYGPVHALTELRIDEAKLALGTKFEELHAFKRLLFVTMAGQGGPLSWRFLLAFARAYPSGGLPMRYALACAERFGEPDAKASVYVAMANVAAKSGDKIIEMTHLQRAVDSLQSLRRGAVGLGEEHTGALRTRFTSDYRRLVGLLHDAGRPGQAQLVRDLLDNAEQGQLGNIADNKPTRRLSPSEQAYDKVAQELRDLGRRERILAKVKHPSPEVLAEIQGMPDRIKATNDRLLAAFDNVLADARRGSASAVDVSEGLDRVKRMLKGQPPGTAAASVLCTPTGVRFVVWTSRGVAQRRSIVDEKVLSAKVEAFRDVLVNPLCDPVVLARELYSWLWKPIEDLLVEMNVRRVLLHLDGPARYVPFGVLHDGKGYVAERWETSLFSPTLTEGMTDRPSRSWSVLAAGTTGARTVTDALGRTVSFTALPGVRTEVSRVRQSVGAGPEPLLDEMFDAKSLARGLASHPKVVHLASHFVFDAGGESLSFLLTGKGQILPVSDTTVLTKEHFAGVELLTLSACQTGRFSQTRDGMEVEGIAGILRRKGVKAVMSTLWPVADTSTAAFMGTFYMLRAQDPRRTKAWCLREAQLRMIRGNVAPPGAPKPVATRGTTSIKVSTKGLRKDWSHPYHWAPFILQGNPL